jgi:hypothetical protein
MERSDPAPLPADVVQIVEDLNPWWQSGRLRKPPPPYQRRDVRELIGRIAKPHGLIEVIRRHFGSPPGTGRPAH